MSKKTFRIKGNLAEAMQDTVSSAQNNAGELHVEVIPLRKINLDPENPRDLALNIQDAYNGITPSDIDFSRKESEKNALSSMAKSIEEQGVINPIVVYKLDNQYRLIAGERRTLASIIAGKQDIPARILTSKPDALKLSLIQWIENIEREDLSLWERMQNLEKIIMAYAKKNDKDISEVTATEISKLIGCSLQQGSCYRSILNAPDDLKKHIKSGEIKNIDKAAFISNSAENLQSELIANCISGSKLTELKTIANESKKAFLEERKAGRPSSIINLGTTENIAVAKNLITTILNHDNYKQLHQYFVGDNWDNHKTLSASFKKLLSILEKI
ncbi:MAG: ParB/RepB/Spo0J family partition protein [Gammaproteobacteria bacterium]|nr:ParB/RepB/Spo0J family partition protein [Gammaproteobacteria bacterium]